MELAEIFNQPSRPTGMMAGYLSGLESGTNIAVQNSQIGKQNLESQRYAAETPDYLKKQQLANEQARINLLPGQANEQAGVYPAEAQSNLGKAKLTAQQAKAALETLPAETQAKLHSEINKGTAAFLEQVATTLKQTGSVEQTIQSIEQSTPKVIQDPGWQAEKQKIMKMNPQQAAAFVDQMRAKIASSSDYATPTSQHDFNKLDIEHINKMKEISAQNEGQLAAVKAKGVSEKNPTQSQFIREQIKIINPNASEAEISKKTLEQMSVVQKMIENGLLGPGMGTTTTQTRGGTEFNPVINPSNQKATSATDYLKGATTKEEFHKRVDALKAKGWTDEQIKAAYKG